MTIPLCVLAVLSIVGGFDKAPFARDSSRRRCPPCRKAAGGITETLSSMSRPWLSYAVFWVAWFVYQRNPATGRGAGRQIRRAGSLHRFWFADWGIDWLYDRLFVRPVVWIARVNKADVVDSIYDGLASLADLLLSRSQPDRNRQSALVRRMDCRRHRGFSSRS